MQWQLLWPGAAVIGLIVPAFLWFYVRVELHRRAAARRHAGLCGDWARTSNRAAIRRHLPAALFLASLTAISIAAMRPTATLTPYAARRTIILVVDVSASMRASDIAPTRLGAAKRYAKQLVADHADTTRFGLVSFAGTAGPEADPSTGREELMTAIERLDVRPGTSIGSGIEAALKMLFPHLPPAALSRDRNGRNSDALPTAEAAGPAPPDRRAPGSHAAAAIVLMSDGQSTADLAPAGAVRAAADLGVRIHTIGIGSLEGTIMRSQGWSMRVQLDEPALKDIASTTAGEYRRASARTDWRRVVDALQPEPPAEDIYTEVTALLAAIAALSATGGALASLLRTQRVL